MIHTSSRIKQTLWLGLVLGNALWAAETTEPAEPAKPVAKPATAKELKEIVVTASRSERAPETIPANVSVISAEEIKKRHAKSVPELLEGVSGVSVLSGFIGNGRDNTVDIRGFGETAKSNTLVLVDGRRASQADLSGVDWSAIPLNQIDRIEIVRGGGSVLYGNQAVGGVINIITRQGAAKPGLTSDTMVGSYNTIREVLNLDGNAGGWYYNGNTSYLDTKGYRENNYMRNKTASLSLGYDNDDWWSLRSNAGTEQTRYGMPGSVTRFEDRQMSHNRNDYAESVSNHAFVTPTGKIGDDNELSLGLGYRDTTTRSWFKSFNWYSRSEIHELSLMPKYEGSFDIGGFENRLVTGVDWIHSEGDLWLGNTSRNELGAYANDTLSLVPKTLFLDFGYRRSRIDYSYDAASTDEPRFDIDSWRGALTWNYQKESKLFIAIDRSFRTQMLDEMGGPWANQPLDAYQTATQYQAGIVHGFGKLLKLGATAFIIDTHNEIFYNSIIFQNETYGRTRRTGVELEATSQPIDELTLSANYTCQNPELKGGRFDGNRIPAVSTMMASAGIGYSPIPELTFDTRMRWQKGRLAISDWNNANPDWEGKQFTTIDARITYRPWKFLEIYAGVNNLLDREYSDYGTYGAATPGKVALYPSPERNLYTGFKVTKEF